MTILKIFAEYKQDTEYVQYLEKTQQDFGEKIQNLCWDHTVLCADIQKQVKEFGEAAAIEANMWLNPQSWASSVVLLLLSRVTQH